MTITGTFPDSEAKAATNRLAIQAKIDTRDIVDLGPGKYFIDSPLVLRNGTHFVGVSPTVSTIQQTNPDASAFEATDLLYATVEGLTIGGPGRGTGNGIHIAYKTQVSCYSTFRRLQVVGFGGTGIQVDHAIVTLFEQVTSQSHGGNAFSVLDGTSIDWRTTFAIRCKVGYNLNSLHYSGLTRTAVDSCEIGYLIKGCRSIQLDACGAELITGNALQIDNTVSLVANAFRDSINQYGVVLVTNRSRRIALVAPQEDQHNASAQYSMQVDPGCQVRVEMPEFSSPTKYAPGTTTVV
jgi:hypothetical protein